MNAEAAGSDAVGVSVRDLLGGGRWVASLFPDDDIDGTCGFGTL